MNTLATITFYGAMLLLLGLLAVAIVKRVWLYRLERGYRLAMRVKEYDRAVSFMNQALDFSSATSLYLQNRARAHYEAGDYARAGVDYNRCLAIYQSASLYLERAMVWLAQGLTSEALVDANHAIACSRFWWRCYFVRARVYFALNHYAVALDDLEQAIEYGAAHHPEARSLATEIRKRLTPAAPPDFNPSNINNRKSNI